jgi:superfamily II DNA or RNA helicase
MNVMATGTGKTMVGTMHAVDVARAGGWALWMAPKKELVWQAVDDFKRATGLPAGVEMNVLESAGEQFVAGTVDSLHRRVGRFADRPPSLVVVDEMHHSAAPTWTKVIQAFPGAKVLGLTATPDRGDGKSHDAIYDVTTVDLQIDWAWENAWLVPAIGRTVKVANNDLRKVKQHGGDFDAHELARAISAAHESMVDEVLKTFAEPEIGQRSTIFFAPSKDAAHEITAMFNARCADMAVAVDGEMDSGERGRAFDAIRGGGAQVIVNFGVIVEGVDVPNVSNVVFGRPTRKRWIAVQMAGRGLRPAAGLLDTLDTAEPPVRARAISDSRKPDCLWTDFVWLSKHNLITPVHLALGGCEGDTRLVKRVARETQERATDLQAAVSRARKHEEKLENDRLARARATSDRLGIEMIPYDPMAGATKAGASVAPGRRLDMTLNQGRELLRIGYFDSEIKGWTKDQATAAIIKWRQRRKAGLASKKQLHTLLRTGIPNAELVSRDLAGRIQDAIKEHGREKVARSQRVLQSVALDVEMRRQSK